MPHADIVTTPLPLIDRTSRSFPIAVLGMSLTPAYLGGMGYEKGMIYIHGMGWNVYAGSIRDSRGRTDSPHLLGA